MRTYLFAATAGLFILLAFSNCKSDYEKLVERELASGIRHDSIFLGMYFGMSRPDFYKHCFELNHQGLITNGPTNNTALYVLAHEFEYPVDMNFYPDFNQEKIWRMRVYYNYQPWAPWNKALFAEKLAPPVLDLLRKWYNCDFLARTTPGGQPFWVAVNGNRQILVSLEDEKQVRAEITDLTNQPEEKPLPKPGKDRPLWEQKH